MRNIVTIIKKELTRFFTDKRMIITLILPGVLIFVLYSLMGSFITDLSTTDTDYTYNVYILNEPEIYKTIDLTDDYNINITSVDFSEIENALILQKIADKEIDLYIIYSSDFVDDVASGLKPSISIYYNSVSNESSEIYRYYYSSLNAIATDITYSFYINNDQSTVFDLATEEEVGAQIITMMLPFLLIIFLYSGCMAISTEAIAGEKERGTIATLLVTPAKRSEIALGKIIALSITALVSATSSFIGLILSLPKLMGGVDINMNIYGIGEYTAIFIVIISTVLLFTVLLSIVSCFAKSSKEAAQYAIPVMVIVMLTGVSSMVSSGATTNNMLYFIPIYNSVQCMSGIFSLSFNLVHFVITILTNIVMVSLGTFILTKMFSNEKIMFNK